jgi:hypothetical protein
MSIYRIYVRDLDDRAWREYGIDFETKAAADAEAARLKVENAGIRCGVLRAPTPPEN